MKSTSTGAAMDAAYHTISGDKPYATRADILAAKPSPLQDAFQKARAMGHDLLLQTSYVDLDMGASLMSLQDTYKPYEAFISMKQGDVPHEALRRIFQKGGQIHGLYDLNKPFQHNAAQVGIDALPHAVDAAIRDTMFEQLQPSLPLWRKALLLSEGYKAAYKASLVIYQP